MLTAVLLSVQLCSAQVPPSTPVSTPPSVHAQDYGWFVLGEVEGSREAPLVQPEKGTVFVSYDPVLGVQTIVWSESTPISRGRAEGTAEFTRSHLMTPEMDFPTIEDVRVEESTFAGSAAFHIYYMVEDRVLVRSSLLYCAEHELMVGVTTGGRQAQHVHSKTLEQARCKPLSESPPRATRTSESPVFLGNREQWGLTNAIGGVQEWVDIAGGRTVMLMPKNGVNFDTIMEGRPCGEMLSMVLEEFLNRAGATASQISSRKTTSGCVADTPYQVSMDGELYRMTLSTEFRRCSDETWLHGLYIAPEGTEAIRVPSLWACP